MHYLRDHLVAMNDSLLLSCLLLLLLLPHDYYCRVRVDKASDAAVVVTVTAAVHRNVVIFALPECTAELR